MKGAIRRFVALTDATRGGERAFDELASLALDQLRRQRRRRHRDPSPALGRRHAAGACGGERRGRAGLPLRRRRAAVRAAAPQATPPRPARGAAPPERVDRRRRREPRARPRARSGRLPLALDAGRAAAHPTRRRRRRRPPGGTRPPRGPSRHSPTGRLPARHRRVRRGARRARRDGVREPPPAGGPARELRGPDPHARAGDRREVPAHRQALPARAAPVQPARRGRERVDAAGLSRLHADARVAPRARRRELAARLREGHDARAHPRQGDAARDRPRPHPRDPHALRGAVAGRRDRVPRDAHRVPGPRPRQGVPGARGDADAPRRGLRLRGHLQRRRDADRTGAGTAHPGDR